MTKFRNACGRGKGGLQAAIPRPIRRRNDDCAGPSQGAKPCAPMSANPPASLDDSKPDIGFREFAPMSAAMMAVNALAIDVMLPALADIAGAVHIATDNGRQWIVTAYILGFGSAQVIYGPIADRFGRRRVILAGLTGYFIFS